MLTGDNGPGLPLVNNPYERLVSTSCMYMLLVLAAAFRSRCRGEHNTNFTHEE
jgi:hypothetical protein